MEVSDLSTEPIEGNAPVGITCTFEDGRRRMCTVTAAEAARLAEEGIDVTTRPRRVWLRLSGVGRLVRKLLPWAAGLLIGSLVLPAVTKQWSDRQGALALKQQLVGDITSKSTAARVGSYNAAQQGAT